MASEKQHLRRDRRLVLGCVTLAVAVASGLTWRVAFAAPVPVLPTRHVTLAANEPLQIVFAGDTMLADAAMPTITANGPDYVLTGVKPLLKGAQEVVINAEAPISERATTGNRGAQYTYAVRPRDADALARAGVTVLNLGNNHAMDRGSDGLAETTAWATAAGVSTVGAGANRAESEKPLIIDTGRGKLGIVSFGENFGSLSRSTVTSPGMVPFSTDKIQRGLTLARSAGADYVVAFVHWGDNYAPINESQRYWASQLADAGYDLVIGTGSHTLQAVEHVNGVPVLYGLGNFVFGSNGRYAQFGQESLAAVARLVWSPDGPSRLELSCIQADNALTGFVPRPCTAAESEVAHAVLGPDVTWNGPTGVLGL